MTRDPPLPRRSRVAHALEGSDLDGPPAPGAMTRAASRWELYRLLADPVRPRLLALASIEELAVGELAELLREGQPKISRHAAALREAGLLAARRQGTWTLLRLSPSVAGDPVVADAVAAGTAACTADGTVARIEVVLGAREDATREFFARGGRPVQAGPPLELGAYLSALAPLLPRHRLAVDAGTGEGPLLEVLSPLFDQVIALDREGAQLDLARERVRRRALRNVTLVRGEIDGPEVRAAVDAAAGEGGGADVVFASRVLHHAKVPARAMAYLAALARPALDGERGGAVCVVDYETHDDLTLRDHAADLWLGFDGGELTRFAEASGLEQVTCRPLPAAWRGEGPDRHLPWQLLVGFRGDRVEAPTMAPQAAPNSGSLREPQAANMKKGAKT
jgi:DNA-binding transcriptional ArsR family regulator